MKKLFLVPALAMLCACSWFHSRPPPPVPPEFIVTGAPAGSIVFVDDVQKGQPAEAGKPQVLTVAAGAHVVEVRVGPTVVYRENTFIKSGEKRVVTVLSGSNRE